MGIIESLYHGEIYPAEKILPATDRYRNALEIADKLVHQLMDQLSPEQLEIFESYCYQKSILAGEVQCECYRQGVLMGVRLYRDLEL